MGYIKVVLVGIRNDKISNDYKFYERKTDLKSNAFEKKAFGFKNVNPC